ncbi:Choline transporter-like [Macleaya cordata]|uniref:Choline transporter-like protein n=1 Tax=Macleaya cordata TaxID=56857 RepID=A0A200Q0M1_MACCD|nr:Choline transporter-like [Macleaya cordata]
MGASDTTVMERETKEERDIEEGEVQKKKKIGEDMKKEAEEDEEEKKFDEEKVIDKSTDKEFKVSMLQTLNPTNPLRIVIQGASQVQIPPPNSHHQHHHQPPVPPLTTPPQQQALMVTTLNSRKFTNKISLFVFLVHMVSVIGLVFFLGYKALEGVIKSGETQRKERKILEFWLPQVEGSAILSIILAFAWQKAMREWPSFTLKFILWSSFLTSLSAGILLLVFQKPSTDGVGVALIAFAIGNGLYACWVTPRIGFTARVLSKSLEPVAKFSDLNQPTYWMLGLGFIWISLWVLAVIGALNFYFPPLLIIGLVLSLAWTAEVLRNVANLTVSRVIALYYLRGMQCSTQFCFQRALSRNLGSACLGSLFVPAIEALRIIARGLNLLEGEDEFMFSCAHCCLRVMESIFRYGNGWAFVQIAAYGKGFVKASQDTWGLFERQEMEQVVDSDITSSVCFLTGVCSGSICVLVTASWTFAVHKDFTATVSLLAFFLGYLLTRIGMALPHACVSCYYVCYAEHPENRLFDETIPDRLNLIKTNRDVVVPTPRVPRRFRT